jgi:hypothetical protein
MGIAELKEEDMPMVYLVLAEVFWRFSQMVVKWLSKKKPQDLCLIR